MQPHPFFPLSSSLLKEELRQPVMDFLSFIHTMEEILSHPQLAREEKRQQLRLLRVTLQEKNAELMPDWALGYHILLEQKRLSPRHGEQLWQAFWQETEKDRYLTMDELLAFSRSFAAPIGKGFLEIAGEGDADMMATEGLCMALHLLQIIQQVRQDYLVRQRIYLPKHWLEEAGVSEKVLSKRETGPKLRQVFEQCYEETEKQFQRAAGLPASLQNRKLRAEVKKILAMQTELLKLIQKNDPMKGRVRLSTLDKFLAGLLGKVAY